MEYFFKKIIASIASESASKARDRESKPKIQDEEPGLSFWRAYILRRPPKPLTAQERTKAKSDRVRSFGDDSIQIHPRAPHLRHHRDDHR